MTADGLLPGWETDIPSAPFPTEKIGARERDLPARDGSNYRPTSGNSRYYGALEQLGKTERTVVEHR
jgi:hypothetical protein